MKAAIVVKVEAKEIQDLLIAEAKRQHNINGPASAKVAFDVSSVNDQDVVGASITFDNLQPKGK